MHSECSMYMSWNIRRLGGELSFRGHSPIQRVLCRCATSQKRKSIVPPHHKQERVLCRITKRDLTPVVDGMCSRQLQPMLTWLLLFTDCVLPQTKTREGVRFSNKVVIFVFLWFFEQFNGARVDSGCICLHFCGRCVQWQSDISGWDIFSIFGVFRISIILNSGLSKSW